MNQFLNIMMMVLNMLHRGITIGLSNKCIVLCTLSLSKVYYTSGFFKQLTSHYAPTTYSFVGDIATDNCFSALEEKVKINNAPNSSNSQD
jgi:hypothetical protein